MREKSEQISALIKSLQQGPPISPEDMKRKADQIAALAKPFAQGIPGAPASVPSTPTPSVTPGDAARHYGVPGSNVVCLYSAFPDPGWFGNAEKYLKDFGYTVLEPKFNMTVDDLMFLPPCAVFGLVSHGTMRFSKGVYDPPLVIYTTTLVTPFTMVQYWDLYENGQLAYYYQREEMGLYLGITEKFVRKFWQFDDNSFVFLDTCFAMNRATQPFRDALFLKNASVIAGWTWKSLDNIGDETASFLFDRLLGANDFEGEFPVAVPREEGRKPDNPKQRPFDWLALEPDMYAKGLGRATDTDYGVVTEIAFQAGKNGDFGLLRPSLKEVYVNDNEDERTLTIHGLFGRKLVRKKRVTLWNDTTRAADGTKKNPGGPLRGPPREHRDQ